ncbi:MAG: glycosyltransferase family 4 protein [Candidatus Eisenbacteria bacterium]|nr:glycosyltransferase family 4 protein [Candidatus Eisenbacteria bacterium]
MSGLRVLIVSPYPFQMDRVKGGVEAVAQVLVPALVSREEIEAVRVVTFGSGAAGCEEAKIDSKLTVHLLPAQRRYALLTGGRSSVLLARQIVNEFRPDIVHAQGVGVYGEVGTCLGVPAVVTVHGMVHVEVRLGEKSILKRTARTWLLDRMVRRVLGRARVVISTSEHGGQMLGKWMRNHHVVISNPVRPAFFDYRREPDPGRILFAGSMIPLKNVLGIVRAFALVKAKVRDARLDLAGPASDADYSAQVRQLVSRLGLGSAVAFHGFVEDNILLELMGRCSVLTLFSIQEAAPTVVSQAMAMGRPVVASRVGGVPEIVIDGDNGFIVEAGDEAALADRLVALLKSQELCQSMGARGREIARQRFEPSIVAHQTLGAYKLAI